MGAACDGASTRGPSPHMGVDASSVSESINLFFFCDYMWTLQIHSARDEAQLIGKSTNDVDVG